MVEVEQIVLGIMMFFTALPAIALPSVWQERGWARVRALLSLLACVVLMMSLTTGYVFLVEYA